MIEGEKKTREQKSKKGFQEVKNPPCETSKDGSRRKTLYLESPRPTQKKKRKKNPPNQKNTPREKRW